MERFSPGVVMLWALAGAEARAGRHENIEPAHLMLGLCKLCDLPLDQVLPADLPGVEDAVAALETEVEQVRSVFRSVGLDVTTFRRRLRGVLGIGEGALASQVIHRSPEARRIFKRAAELSSASGEEPRASHVLGALLVRDAALLWENLELQEREKEFEEELRQARAIQVDLFPNRYDLDERVEIAAENIPCKWVSGDYYDFQKLHAGRLTFTIADVRGHGLSAALLMASVQSVFRTGVRFGWPLEEIDRAINQMAMANTASDVFVTGLLGVCDLDASELSLISAGHRWPSLMLGEEQAALDESQHRFAWGMVDERSGPFVRFHLPEGDWSFVAYTDGLENPTHSPERGFPLDTIPQLQRDLSQRIASELCETIIKAVFAFADKASVLADDITLLVLRGMGKG